MVTKAAAFPQPMPSRSRNYLKPPSQRMKDAKNTLIHRSSLIFIKFPITDSRKCSLGSTLPCVHTIRRRITHTKSPTPCVALVPIDLHTLLATSSCNYQSILALFSAPNKTAVCAPSRVYFRHGQINNGVEWRRIWDFCRWLSSKTTRAIPLPPPLCTGVSVCVIYHVPSLLASCINAKI